MVPVNEYDLSQAAWPRPTLLGAPGPTEMTVASGSGLLVADEGRKMPVAVFCGGNHAL